MQVQQVLMSAEAAHLRPVYVPKDRRKVYLWTPPSLRVLRLQVKYGVINRESWTFEQVGNIEPERSFLGRMAVL